MTISSRMNSALTSMFMSPLSGERGAQVVNEQVGIETPKMVARFGTTELRAMCVGLSADFPGRGRLRKHMHQAMVNLSGFYPSDESDIERFSSLMVDDCKQLDVLGSYRIEEALIKTLIGKNVRRVALSCLEPYLSIQPWSGKLSDKRVVVVHPFSKLIEKQYSSNREKLFPGRNVLPVFKSFQVIKAVQTIAANNSGYVTWFHALNSMKEKLSAATYDVAIIGCGAYGFPLAAHVKREGKTAIHLGGATQILFGIKGARWDGNPSIAKMYNDSWVRPGVDETPPGAAMVEGGCYW